MREFFRGWRRKLAVVTLGLALACMCPWVRSLRHFDAYHVPVGTITSVCIMSVAGSITLNLDIHEDGENEANEQHYDLSERWRFKIPINDWFDGFSQFEGFMKIFRLKWRWCGFGIGVCLDGPQPHPLFAIPYWAIVLTLTLISAWLLLSKPRPHAPQLSRSATTAGE